MKYLLLQLIMLLLMGRKLVSETNYCRMKCKEKLHTMCKYKPGPAVTCGKSYGGLLSSADKKQILRLHNEHRMKIANGKEPGMPKAADMMEMVWDRELELVAQRWADQCLPKLQHDDCRYTAKFRRVGQNTARAFYLGNSHKLVKLWYDEVKLFDAKHISSYKFNSATGHFTQLIWATSTHIGCGRVQWNEKQVLVCNYGPSGNTLRLPLYKRGSPCSKCPKRSRCSSKYKGLCRPL